MRLDGQEREELLKYLELFDFTDFIKGKTFLLTGSKGIVGTGIMKWLLLENELHGAGAKVIASTRDVGGGVPSYIDSSDDVAFCSFGQEAEFCKGRAVDYVIHTAAPTSNKVFRERPVESIRTIIDGTERMLDLARDHDSSMVYLSSEEAYGTPNSCNPITEDYFGPVDSLNIRSCYPLGKKAAELLCRSYYEQYGVDVKIIRPTVILGLYQPYDSVKVEAEILRCIVEGSNLHMKSDGSTSKCVIYTMDALSAVLTVLFKGLAGEAYNATNPVTFCSVKDRAYQAFEEFAPELDIEFESVDTSQSLGYLPKRQLLEDIGKIEELGWKPYAGMSDIYRIDLRRFGKL